MFDYLILIIILSCGIVSYFVFQHQPVSQLLAVSLTAVSYIAWGVWHHWRRGGLYWPVVLEYILVAGLVVALTYSLVL